MTASADIVILDEPPSPCEFVALRTACGWGEISVSTATGALASSLLVVSVRQSGEILGFGRVVGDGSLCFYIQDVIVAPHARNHGIGRLIMERLMMGLRDIAPKGAMIGLMSATGKEGFYERFGFARRPTEGYGAGMTQFF